MYPAVTATLAMPRARHSSAVSIAYSAKMTGSLYVKATLRPFIDGVVLECARHRATFLPQVWEQLPDPREFLRALKRKAGLVEDYWSDRVRVSRYTVEKFVEGVH